MEIKKILVDIFKDGKWKVEARHLWNFDPFLGFGLITIKKESPVIPAELPFPFYIFVTELDEEYF